MTAGTILTPTSAILILTTPIVHQKQESVEISQCHRKISKMLEKCNLYNKNDSSITFATWEFGASTTLLIDFARALGLPDLRTGANTQYNMYDFVGSALSVFFTQTPSFLSHQKKMEMENGHNNARSLFGIQKFPTANQIRNILTPLPKDSFKPIYSEIHKSMEKKGVYKEWRCQGWVN